MSLSDVIINPTSIRVFSCRQFKTWEEVIVNVEVEGWTLGEDVTKMMNFKNKFGFTLSECIRPPSKSKTVHHANIILKEYDRQES